MMKQQQKPRKKSAVGGSKEIPAVARSKELAKNPRLPRVRWLSLRDIPSCRKAMALVTKEFKLHLISEMEARAMVYALRGVLSALEAERQLDYEKQLEAVNGRMADLEKAFKERAS